jgi:hypothetical protein
VVFHGQMMDPWQMLDNISFSSYRNTLGLLLPPGRYKICLTKRCMAHCQTISDETIQIKLFQPFTGDGTECRFQFCSHML